jgi:DNA-binding Lrp family transcriptional regulator
MLRKFLRLAFGRDTTETAELARELDVSVQQVRMMVETLERLGYLEKVAAGCEQSCEHCAQYPACLPNESPQIWKLTGKGERYLAAGREAPD